MGEYKFVDAVTGDAVVFDVETGDARMSAQDEPPACTSLFFPGCSFINYALPLVSAVYDTLRGKGVVDGISLLCCGKILSYEADGAAMMGAFQRQLSERLADTQITRIVAACPNCVKALREGLAADERTAHIEVAVLPQVLADLGYRVDRDTVATLVKGSPDEPVLLCTHDSCPDRDKGEFARGLRALLPEGVYTDPAHTGRKSLCCGSSVRAAGKFEAADRIARRNGEEALETGADAIVTACLSCTFQLNMAQPHVQVLHVLELLYSWRIDWAHVGAWMKYRFLFDETLGVVREGGSERAFKGLGGSGDE